MSAPTTTKAQKFEKRTFRRTFAVRADSVDTDARTAEVSFSSEEPVREFLEDTVLLHESGAMDTGHLERVGSILLNHDPNQVIGVPESITLDEAERKGRATIRFGSDEDGERVFRKVRDGVLRGVSVGYRAVEGVRIEDGEQWNSPGKRTFRGPLVVATKWEPREISLTPIPADGSVGVGRTEDGMKLTSEQRQLLVERGLDAEATDEDALEFLLERVREGGSQEGDGNRSDDELAREELENIARDDEAHGTDDDNREVLERAAAARGARLERTRAAEIRRLGEAARANNWISDEDINGWIQSGRSVEFVRQALVESMIEHNRPMAPVATPGVSHPRDGDDRFRSEHEAWLARRVKSQCASLTSLEVDETTGREIPPDLPLYEFMRRCLVRSGVRDARGWTKHQLADNLTSRAFQHSTSDFPNILGNVANKSVAQGFMEAPVTWTRWCARGSLPDFKSADRTKLSEVKQFVETPELMPVQESTILDAKETTQVKTYATRIGLSRQAIVNDDLSAFGRIPSNVGAAAARTVEVLVYTIFSDNPTMNEDSTALFGAHTSGSNTDTNVLSLANLTTGRAAMRKQTGLNSERIDVIPMFIITAVDLESTAANILNGLFVPTAESGARPAWVGALEMIATPHLTSATEWYLAASPSQIDTILVSGLGSTSVAPTLVRNEGTSILGLEWIAYLDVAVDATEHRGLYRGNT